MPEWWEFPILALAAWRLSTMLVLESGPFEILLRWRELIGITHDDDGFPAAWPNKVLPGLFSCVACMSVWMAGFCYLIWWLSPVPIWVLAASGVAVVIHHVTSKE